MTNTHRPSGSRHRHTRSALRDWRLMLAMLPVLGLAAPAARSAPLTGDAATGKTAFSACRGWHSVTPVRNGVGPSLAGVVGRQSGTVSGYNYSAPMKSANLDWDAASLDRFLANPQAVVHGTKMFVNVPNAATRRDIIAYLANSK
jgi:cytochrome c